MCNFYFLFECGGSGTYVFFLYLWFWNRLPTVSYRGKKVCAVAIVAIRSNMNHVTLNIAYETSHTISHRGKKFHTMDFVVIRLKVNHVTMNIASEMSNEMEAVRFPICVYITKPQRLIWCDPSLQEFGALHIPIIYQRPYGDGTRSKCRYFADFALLCDIVNKIHVISILILTMFTYEYRINDS